MNLTQSLFTQNSVVYFTDTTHPAGFNCGLVLKVTGPQIHVQPEDGGKPVIFWRKNRQQWKNAEVTFRFAAEEALRVTDEYVQNPEVGEYVVLRGTNVDGLVVYKGARIEKVTDTELTLDLGNRTARFMRASKLERGTQELKWEVLGFFSLAH